MNRLAGKRILVTGGATRIGASLVRQAAAKGCKVVLHHHHSHEPAQALMDQLQDEGREVHGIHGDLSDPSGLEAIMHGAMDHYGGLDGLVNNAAAYPPATLETVSWDDMDDIIRTNSWAPFALTRAFAEAGGQSVVNLLDTRLVDVDARHIAYHFSKTLLRDMTQVQARLLAPTTRVNGVAPGPVLEPAGSDDKSYLERVGKLMPLQRTPAREEIADAVLYLLAAESVTGQVIHVDGGRHLGRAIEDPTQS